GRAGRRGCAGGRAGRGRGTGALKREGEGTLLRIFIGESDTWHGKPLYQAIVQRLREDGLAGATVLRAIEGFGASSRLHTARILRLAGGLPLVIEVVGTAEKGGGRAPTREERG